MIARRTQIRCLHNFGVLGIALTVSVPQGEAALEEISASAVVAYESEYVYRGQKLAGQSVQPSLELGHPLGRGDLFIGAWASYELRSDPFEEERFYAGYQQSLSPIFSVTGGFTYYWLPDEESVPANQEEPFLGLTADLPFSPSIFAYYNFALDQTLLELSLRESYTLLDSVSLETAILLGAAHGEITQNGNQESKQKFLGFAVAYADLAFDITDEAIAFIGLRYSASESGDFSDFFWWGGSIVIWF